MTEKMLRFMKRKRLRLMKGKRLRSMKGKRLILMKGRRLILMKGKRLRVTKGKRLRSTQGGKRLGLPNERNDMKFCERKEKKMNAIIVRKEDDFIGGGKSKTCEKRRKTDKEGIIKENDGWRMENKR